jgi:hypothetical protein
VNFRSGFYIFNFKPKKWKKNGGGEGGFKEGAAVGIKKGKKGRGRRKREVMLEEE